MLSFMCAPQKKAARNRGGLDLGAKRALRSLAASEKPFCNAVNISATQADIGKFTIR